MRFFDGPDDVRRARQCLDEAGFTLDALTERLGVHAFAHLGQGELAPLVRATREGDGLDTLLRLFVGGMPVSLAAARAALQPLAVEEWVAGGVLTADDADVSSRIAIRPVGGPSNWLIAHDFTRRHGTALPDDHVLGMSASTQALAGATIRREITSAFDLGTGCGVQALYASEHAARVVASDLNPRAGACATLTMELNDVTNVAVREGSLFEPVEGERFDLIVANPPFVISPSRRYLFRDNEMTVDEICRQLVRSAPSHLTDGGHCQLLASWAHVRGQDWREPAARLVRGHGVRRPGARTGGVGTGRPRGELAPTDGTARPVGTRVRRLDGLLRTARRRSRRFRPHQHAEASGRDAVVPRRASAAGLGDAVRRPPRSGLRTGRLRRRHAGRATPRRRAADRTRRRPRRTCPRRRSGTAGSGRTAGR